MGQSPLAYVQEGLMGLLGAPLGHVLPGSLAAPGAETGLGYRLLSHPDWAVSAVLRVPGDLCRAEKVSNARPWGQVTSHCFQKNSGMVPNGSWKTLQIFLRLGPHETLGQ